MMGIIMDIHMEVIMNSTRFLRNKDLIPQDKLDHIGIVGLGGIGSQLVPLLSIMGFKKLTGWDDDSLEEHNLSTTMYPQGALGSQKVDIAKNIFDLYKASNEEMTIHDDIYDEDSGSLPKMIVCLDNMEDRLIAYQQWLNQDNREIFLDLRMGAMAMEIITVTKKADYYLDSWLPTHQIEQAPCTMKHTIFTASTVGGIGVGQVFNVVASKPYYAYIWIGLMPLQIRKEHLII
jgi:hypothetical protein